MSDDAFITLSEPPGDTLAAAPPSRRALRRGVAVVVGIGAVAALALGVSTVDGRTLAAGAGAPAAIAGSLVMVLAAWLAEGVVFAALAGGGLAPRRVACMSAVYLGGSFPSAVTPFASGAIPTWTWLLTREGLSAGGAAAVVGLRSAVTSAFFALAAAVAAVVLPGVLGPAWGRAIIGLVAVVLAFIALLAAAAARPRAAAALVHRLAAHRPFTRLARFEHRLTDEFALFSATLRDAVRRRPIRLLLALLATCVSRALLFSVPFVLLLGFGARQAWLPLVLGMLAVQTVGSATPSPGGSGFSEASLAALLHGGVPGYLVGATVVLWRLLTFWLEMAAGAVVFSRAVRGRSR